MRTRTRNVIGATSMLTLLYAATAATQPAEPLVEFMGSRFYIAKSDISAFEGIAFDPLTEQVYSQGVFDVCGTLVDSNFQTDAGLSWDPVNEEVWKINTLTRDVYRDGPGGPELIFNIPLIFEVPGVGPDTLEAPKGLALDATHVYVVDAGPELGVLQGQAWFKFTRDGTPVSSSKATDFVSGIVAPPDDAVIDGITWCPPTSPVAPGLFLVAFEHTGMLVIDEDGFVIDDIVWEEDGLVYGESAPFAFAGITIDPVRGDLYLADNNGGGSCHVWVRVPEEEYVLLGSTSNVHFPDVRCPRQLLQSGPNSGLVFGLAYRPLDGLVWGTNYSTGDIVKMNPRSGAEVEVIANGGWGFNYWGIAYDEERDDFYLNRGANILYVMEDPENPDIVQLTTPNGLEFFGEDIAFNSDDDQIYVTADVDGEDMLIRVNRDDGHPMIVGPSIFTGGLTYDPATGQLIGIAAGAADNSLHAIDPATGNATLIVQSATQSFGWEGLVLLPGPSTTVSVQETAPAESMFDTRLRMAPNPFRVSTRIGFALEASSLVSVIAYDVRGRVVRELVAGVLGAGEHAVVWDGRDERGARVSPGVYFMRMDGANAPAEKVLLMR